VHFVHSGNNWSDCPIQLGDTRTVFIEVAPLLPEQWLDWDRQLKPALETEAPAFMAALQAIQLPEIGHKRLYLPVLTTAAKERVMERLREESRVSGWQTLLEAVVSLARKRRAWRGSVSKLAVALGPSHGEWSSTARYLSAQLKQLDEAALAKAGVKIARLSRREIEIKDLAAKDSEERW
jgi:hypothetical protein